MDGGWTKLLAPGTAPVGATSPEFVPPLLDDAGLPEGAIPLAEPGPPGGCELGLVLGAGSRLGRSGMKS